MDPIEESARVFVDAQAARMLDNAELDARPDGNQVAFRLIRGEPRTARTAAYSAESARPEPFRACHANTYAPTVAPTACSTRSPSS